MSTESLPTSTDDVLLFSPHWAEAWVVGWYYEGKWYVDPIDEPVRCLTDEGCKVERWQPMPEIPEPWKSRWLANPY